MNKNIEKINPLSKCHELFDNLLSESREVYNAVMQSDCPKIIMENTPIVKELNTIFRSLKSVSSIPDLMFINKLTKFLNLHSNISEVKRRNYKKTISKEKFTQHANLIFEIIDKTEETEKIKIYAMLCEALYDKKISHKEFNRLIIMVRNTMLQDINYMNKNIRDGLIKIKYVEEEALAACGWLIIRGQQKNPGNLDNINLYSYTKYAVILCKKVLNTKINHNKKYSEDDIVKNNYSTKEDIDNIFNK